MTSYHNAIYSLSKLNINHFIDLFITRNIVTCSKIRNRRYKKKKISNLYRAKMEIIMACVNFQVNCVNEEFTVTSLYDLQDGNYFMSLMKLS